jgi:flagellar hook-length control protein FliK
VVPPKVDAPNIVSGESLLTPTIAPRDLGSTLAVPRRLPIRAELGRSLSAERVKEDIVSTSSASAFGLSLPKPSLSLAGREDGSISVGSVPTESARAITSEYSKDAASPLSLSADGVGETPLSQATSTPQIGSTQPVAPSADPLRFVVDRQLDLARDSRWLDALARDIVAVADAPDRLSFRLSPPQLGQLDVNLSSSDNGLSVRMNASTEAATQIIAAAQPRLIDELKSQGVRVADAHVSTGGGGQSQGQGQPQQQRDADQMIEFVRQRIERNNETNLTRPTGRFA